MNQLHFLAVLAWRNLWRSKRRTIITFSSIGFAVFLAIAMESVNTGQHEQIIANMVRMSTGYLQYQDSLYWDERSLDNTMELTPGFETALGQILPEGAYYVPRLESFALVAGEQNARAALIYGVDFAKENLINKLEQKVVTGGLPLPDSNEVLVPIGIADKLGLGVGDTLVIIGQGYQGMQAAGKYIVSGTIKFPISQQNDLMVYLHLSTAQTLFAAYNRVTALLLMAGSEQSLLAHQPQLQSLADEYALKLRGWKSLNPDMVSALEFDKASGQIMLLILYIVIGFGIFGTILTMTLEREKEFGTMLSIGMKRWKLALVSLMETVLICAIGILSGVAIGLPLTHLMKANPIPITGDIAKSMEQFGMEAVITFSTAPYVYFRQAYIVFFIAFVVATYPIWRAFTLNILKTIRS